MESNWATEHLQVIRTLMERTAVYRRALAPIMLAAGAIGTLAAAGGYLFGIETSRAFGGYWGAVSAIAVAMALLLARLQALKDKEPFWSPPTRRVSEAVLPGLVAGALVLAALFLPRWNDALSAWWLPPIWMILYGCAIHAAGFFMPRGMKWFGWGFILIGGGLFLGLSLRSGVPPMRYAHLLMGGAFGVLHLAYGAYLYITERKRNSK